MSEATLKRLLIAVAVLVVVYAGVRVASAVTRPGPGGGALDDALSAFRADSLLGAVTTSPSGEQVELRRDGTRWTANGYPVDSVAADRLVRAADSMAVEDLVARSPESHSRLGVKTDSTWRVELRGRRDTLQLLVGGAGRVYRNSYVRLPDADNVYEVSGDLRNTLAMPLADWRDKTIASTDTAEVKRIVVERNRERYEVVRSDTAWHLGATPANRTRVDAMLMELSHFGATGFPPDSAAFSGRETRRVTALGANGDTLARIEFAGDSTAWLARTAGGPSLFQAAPYRVDRLTPPRAEVARKN